MTDEALDGLCPECVAALALATEPSTHVGGRNDELLESREDGHIGQPLAVSGLSMLKSWRYSTSAQRLSLS